MGRGGEPGVAVATSRLKTRSRPADDNSVGPLFSLAAPCSDPRHGPVGDAGFIVVSSLAKITLAVAVIGTAGYDAISMTSTHLSVQDHAQTAAAIGYDTLVNTRSEKSAYKAVLKYVRDQGDTLVPGSFDIGKDRTVTVTLEGEARTIAASHLPAVKNYVVATGTGSAGDPIR